MPQITITSADPWCWYAKMIGVRFVADLRNGCWTINTSNKINRKARAIFGRRSNEIINRQFVIAEKDAAEHTDLMVAVDLMAHNQALASQNESYNNTANVKQNVMIGYDSLLKDTTGDSSVFIGIKESKPETTIDKIKLITDNLYATLKDKNIKYGDSALKPLGVFSKASAENGILVRLDDKLSRVKNSYELRKNDVFDLMGYLILLACDKNWTDFKDQED